MKKRIITLSVVILIVLSAFFSFRNKDKPVFPRRKIDDSVLNSFFTKVEDSDGNYHIINISYEIQNNKYIGTVYLPGEFIHEGSLMWDNPEIIVSIDQKTYKSGKIAIPQDGETISYLVTQNKDNYECELTTIITSKEVEPLFIDIDETLGTIENMNSDQYHNTSCYGHTFFNNEKYIIDIKGRGNSTWRDGPKKPYNITFLNKEYSDKKKVSMIDGVESKKWSLLANYGDPSLLRNRLGYSLANKLGVGLASKYYDVWMNGNYLGNYLITPKNDYEATDDGFILEIDNNIDEEDPQFNIYNDRGVIDSLLFTIKNDDGEYGSDEIQRVTQVAWDAIEYYNSDLYQDYIDIDTWSKVYLLNELFKNYDIVNGSILMHRDNKEGDTKLIAGPIWDLDNALGTMSFNELVNIDYGMNFSDKEWYINSLSLDNNDYCFFQELAKHESFIQAVKDIYANNKDYFVEVKKEIDLEHKQNYKSFLADFYKWGNERTFNNYYIDSNWEYDDKRYVVDYVFTKTYEDYYQNLLTYIIKRLEYIDNNINDIK